MNQKQSIALIDSSLRMTAELSVTVARESSGAIFEGTQKHEVTPVSSGSP